MRQDAGLSTPRTGDHQQRWADVGTTSGYAVLDGGALLALSLFKK